jgi:TonB family protein
MFLSSMHDNVSRNTPVYVFEIQQLFMRENLPVGTEYAMLAVADGLTKGTDLRTNLGRIVQAIIHREGGRINAMELLSLILMASASPDDPLPGDRMERAIYETLGFILDVRQPFENSREGELGEGIMNEKERLQSWLEPLILAGPLERASSRGRNRLMLVIALCGMLVASLVVGFSRRRHQSSDNAGAPMRGLLTSGSRDGPNTLAPVVGVARGIEWLPSHNAQFRSKARAQMSEKSETQRKPPSPTAPPIAVGTLSLPIGESRLHSAGASTNVAVPTVSNSMTRPKEVLANPTRPKTAAPAEVSTAFVTHAVSVSGPKPDAPPRSLVQSGSAGIMAANLIWSPTPAYPAAASEAKVEGEVTVNAIVGKDGNVLSATVVSGPPLLREAALKAVEKWQYHPYLVSGKPAVVATRAIIDFELAHD